MELVPRRTTPESLSFNVRMCARLAAPLAFFYLGWISENGMALFAIDLSMMFRCFFFAVFFTLPLIPLLLYSF
jgi:hypothetical protein